jgi:hypothetical protein
LIASSCERPQEPFCQRRSLRYLDWPGAPGTRQVSQECLTEPSLVLPLTASGISRHFAAKLRQLSDPRRSPAKHPWARFMMGSRPRTEAAVGWTKTNYCTSACAKGIRVTRDLDKPNTHQPRPPRSLDQTRSAAAVSQNGNVPDVCRRLTIDLPVKCQIGSLETIYRQLTTAACACGRTDWPSRAAKSAPACPEARKIHAGS